MALQKRTVTIPLGGGQRDDVDDRLLSPPFFNALKNAEFSKEGVVNKVNGADQNNDTGLLGTEQIHTLGTRGGELLAIQRGSGGGLHRYSTLGAGQWERSILGGVYPVSSEWRKVRRGQYTVQSISVAHANGFTVYAWVEAADDDDDSGDAYFVVLDEATQSVVAGPTLMTTINAKVQAIATDSSYAIVYGEAFGSGGGADLYGLVIDLSGSAPSVGGETFVRTKGAADSWDVAAHRGFNTHYIAVAASSTEAVMLRMDRTLTILATVGPTVLTSFASNRILGLYWLPDLSNGRLHLCYGDSSLNLFITQISTVTFAAFSTPVAVGRAGPAANFQRVSTANNDVWLVFQDTTDPGGNDPRNHCVSVFRYTATHTPVSTGLFLIEGVNLLGRPYWHSSYGAVFLLATPSNATGEGEEIDANRWNGGSGDIATSGQVASVTPWGATGFLAFPYLDLGGTRPGAEGSPSGAGTPNYRAQLLAKFGVDEVDIPFLNARTLPQNTPVDDEDTALVPCVSTFRFRQLTGVTQQERAGAAAKIDFQPQPVAIHEVGEHVAVAGGHLSYYDQEVALELGALSAPHIWQVGTAEDPGGGLISAELASENSLAGVPAPTADNFYWRTGHTYTFEFAFVWRDKLGAEHRSATTEVVITELPHSTGAGNDFWERLRFYVAMPPELYLHQGHNHYRDVEIEVYAPEPHKYGTGDGNPEPRFYTQRLATVFNDDGWQVVQVHAASHLPQNYDGRAASYVRAGELGAEPVPPALDMIPAKGRLWLINRDDRTQIWPSKPIVKGLAPEFNAALAIRVPEDGDGFTALAEQDDKIIAFTDSGIYYVAGEGPDATGSGSFIGPKRIVSDIGAISRTGVVVTPRGTMFASRRGVMLLDRNQVTQHVGAPIEDLYDPSTHTVYAATLVPEKNQVRYLIDSGTEVYILLYDYERDAWSHMPDRNGQHAVEWRGEFSRAITRRVYNETSGNWNDSSAATEDELPVLETGWIKLVELSGRKRVWRVTLLGRYYSGNVKVSLAYDYAETYTDTYEWLEADLTAGPVELTCRPSQTRCEALRVKIEETDPSPSALGQWMIPTGITLEYGVKPGANRSRSRSFQK